LRFFISILYSDFTETELVLKNRWVIPAKLEKAKVEFQYKTIQEAFQDILQP